MRAILKSALAAGCLLGLAVPAAAQAPGLELKVNPRVGVYVPLTDLGDAGGAVGTVVSEQSGNLALGLGVELDLAMLPFGLRANVDYATGSRISAPGLGDPVDRTVIMLAGDLIFRPLPTLILVEPYLFAGGGMRQYSFDRETLDDLSDPMVHLGGGLDLSLGPLALNAEVGDYISWLELQEGADSEMQHDLFVSLGIVLGLL